MSLIHSEILNTLKRPLVSNQYGNLVFNSYQRMQLLWHSLDFEPYYYSLNIILVHYSLKNVLKKYFRMLFSTKPH